MVMVMMHLSAFSTDGMVVVNLVGRGEKQVFAPPRTALLDFPRRGKVERVVLRLRVNRMTATMVHRLVQDHIVMLDGLVQTADGVAGLEVGAGLADGGVGVKIVVVDDVATGVALSRVGLDALPDVVREVGVDRPTAIALSYAPIQKYNQ